jgi:hypothetical protein
VTARLAGSISPAKRELFDAGLAADKRDGPHTLITEHKLLNPTRCERR